MIPRAAIPYLWMTVVFLLSSVPAGALPASPIRGADKVIHFLLYGVLVLAFRPAAASRRLPGEWLPGAVAAALVFAMFDEVHQSWVPGRSPDTIANVAGYHTAAAEVGKVAAEAGVRGLLLTHFVPTRFVREALLEEVRADFSGPLLIGEDLMRVDLSTGTVRTGGPAGAVMSFGQGAFGRR